MSRPPQFYVYWLDPERGRYVEIGEGALSAGTAKRIERELRKECGGSYKVVPIEAPAPLTREEKLEQLKQIAADRDMPRDFNDADGVQTMRDQA